MIPSRHVQGRQPGAIVRQRSLQRRADKKVGRFSQSLPFPPSPLASVSSCGMWGSARSTRNGPPSPRLAAWLGQRDTRRMGCGCWGTAVPLPDAVEGPEGPFGWREEEISLRDRAKGGGWEAGTRWENRQQNCRRVGAGGGWVGRGCQVMKCRLWGPAICSDPQAVARRGGRQGSQEGSPQAPP